MAVVATLVTAAPPASAHWYAHRINGGFLQTYGIIFSNGSNNSCAEWWLPSAAYFVGFQGRYGSTGVDSSGWNWGDF